MKLYVDEHGTAPSPRRVRIFLAEKELRVPLEPLELHVANRTPEFKKKNPMSTLPVLELDDGTCISESIAICRYFEELHPEPALFGKTPLEVAEIEMWTRRVDLHLYIPIELANPDFLGPEVAARFRRGALRTMARLDEVLRDREFIAGNRYSFADLYALSGLDFGLALGFEIAADLESFARWHRTVSARPSARA